MFQFSNLTFSEIKFCTDVWIHKTTIRRILIVENVEPLTFCVISKKHVRNAGSMIETQI